MPRRFHAASYLILLGISFFALGLSIPAMSLIVVSKQYSLAHLSLAMVIYSVVVMLFEVPSGMFADTHGRKRCFALGLLFSSIGTALFFASSFPLLCLGFGFSGFGRAFGSGSLDALYLEAGRDAGKKLGDLVLAMEVNSSLCLSIGSLAGGFLLSLGTSGPGLTFYVVGARLVLLLLNLLLLPFLIAEPARCERQETSGMGQTARLLKILGSHPFLVAYILSVLLQGLLLASLESYWQPFLRDLFDSDSQLWILGLIAASIFAVSVLGSFAGKHLMHKMNPKHLYLFASLMVFSLLALLSFSATIRSFLVWYVLIYLVLGIMSVVGLFLLNEEADDSVRSSLSSLSSFSLQGGGLLANLAASLLFLVGDISMFWKVVAALGIAGILLLAKPLLQRSPRS